jgi:hypothetical protein
MFGDLTGGAEPMTAATAATIGPTGTPLSMPPVVTTERELVTLVEDAKDRKTQVLTQNGERIVCTGFPIYPTARQGMHCRARVTRQDGKAQYAAFWKWE